MASFGWSASDLILVIQTVGTVINALDKAEGAQAHYQETINFLLSLQTTLTHLRSATTVGLDPSYTAAVHTHVDFIRSPLVAFIDDISKYEKSLGALSTRGPLRAFPRKVQWAFEVQEKVSKLERKIATPLACIGILLTQQTAFALSILQKEVSSSICCTIAGKIDQTFTECIREELQPLLDHNSTGSGQINDREARQDFRLREISAYLDQLNRGRPETPDATTVAQSTQEELYLETCLYAIAAGLRALWQSLLAVSGPEILLLLHALRISLESIISMSAGDSFTFIDIYGRKGRLPWTWFQSWETFNDFTKSVQHQTVGKTLGQEMAMMDVYGLNKKSQASNLMVRHELWSFLMRPRLELALAIIVVTISENEPDCPRCFDLRTPDQKCFQTLSSTCGLLFYRPFVSASMVPNAVVSEPYKVKISATPSADIASWSERGIGYWQPIWFVNWLDNVKRVVSIYTRRPSTKLILFTFDCVLEQLRQTWSTNSKLRDIILEEARVEQAGSGDLIIITYI